MEGVILGYNLPINLDYFSPAEGSKQSFLPLSTLFISISMCSQNCNQQKLWNLILKLKKLTQKMEIITLGSNLPTS